MITLVWTRALLRRRVSRIVGAAAGVALAVGLLASLGAFLTTAKSEMTTRAVQQVPVDWQVELQSGATPNLVSQALHRRHDVTTAVPMFFATTTGLQASTAGTTQSTGPGVVLGLAADYRAKFPTELRTLAGADTGVLVAQQTAANLHVAPGDSFTLGVPGRPPATLRVDGVVDLPAADSLFQRVGAPAGAQPQAPPDNVVLLDAGAWHELFDGTAGARTQIHVRLDHTLPHDPAAAFAVATSAAHRLEANLAGRALVGNNLAATLDAARADALYAEVLFILLGLPGALLAALLTRAVAAASASARRREAALLRARGATVRQIMRLVVGEAALVAGLGATVGIALAFLVSRFILRSSSVRASTLTGTLTGTLAGTNWLIASAAAGVLITTVALVLPARRDAKDLSVMTARRRVSRDLQPLALRLYLDALLLGGAAVVFWATSRGHYNLVLAPEGIPTVSVNYWALSGPLLLWAGTGVFTWRVVETTLGRGRRIVRIALRPIAGALSGPAAATLRRQRQSLSTGVVLVALTATFAISTAVFNTTYRNQVQVDALLTNGAAVTVTETPAAGATPADIRRIAAVPGVGGVEAMQHRFVYVGADLQDLYGVNAATIRAAAKLQDAYFAGGSAKGLLAELGRRPDAVLVSDETVKDFQLHLGDRVNLRVRDAATGALKDVRFTYAGTVKEFPTAPRDSFIVANAAYVAGQTGDAKLSTLLVSTHGVAPRVVAQRVRAVAGSGAIVSDIDTTRRVVGSSLTAVNLAGLTEVELGFALILVLAAMGLVLGLGLAQRQRSFAIVSALGARRNQLAVFARSEAAVFVVLGGALGVAGGWTLAHMLVKVLTGVFDPAPASLAVPWRYLFVLSGCAAGGVIAAVKLQLRSARRPLGELVRDL